MRRQEDECRCMQTGLIQKPMASATGGSQAYALTLHEMIVSTDFLVASARARFAGNARGRGLEIAAAVEGVATSMMVPHNATRHSAIRSVASVATSRIVAGTQSAACGGSQLSGCDGRTSSSM